VELGLAGKVAIVTGGTEGIGGATVRTLAREGARVAFCARRRDPLDALAAEIERDGGVQLPVQADVTAPADLTRLVDTVVDRFGRIDILVNNAGTSNAKPFEATDDAGWQADFELKVFAAIRLCRLVSPQMRQQADGRIVNVTAPLGKAPPARSMPTSVSRAAGLAFTKALSRDLGPDGIRVNSVCVDSIKSNQRTRIATEQGLSLEEHHAQVAATVPLGRVGEAEEVANVIVFLVSDASSFITGASVNVDGGGCAVL
jgi:3-oxoacyl-[acyl-carrier protein] reductase